MLFSTRMRYSLFLKRINVYKKKNMFTPVFIYSFSSCIVKSYYAKYMFYIKTKMFDHV